MASFLASSVLILTVLGGAYGYCGHYSGCSNGCCGETCCHDYSSNYNSNFKSNYLSSDSGLKPGHIVAITLGVIAIIALKVCICYYRIRRWNRLSQRRTVVVTRQVRVVQPSGNPLHAGYDQLRSVKVNSPVGVLRQTTAAAQTPANMTTAQGTTEMSPPPPYTAAAMGSPGVPIPTTGPPPYTPTPQPNKTQNIV